MSLFREAPAAGDILAADYFWPANTKKYIKMKPKLYSLTFKEG
jgi:hypothetical protein